MKRPFAVIGFSMLFAVTISVFLSSALTFAAAGLACLIVLVIASRRAVFRKYTVWSVALLTVVLTFLLTEVVTQIRTRPAVKYEGETAVIEGQILDYPTKSYGRYYYEVKVQSLTDDQDAVEEVSFKIRMTSSMTIIADPYDHIRCEVTFYRFTSGFGLSSESAYWADGFVLGAYTTYGGCTVTPTEQKPIGYYFKQVRHTLTKGMQVLLPENQAAIVNAMLLGDRDGISEETTSNFRNSGVTHMLVVSGMHMAMIAGMIMWVLQLLKISRKWRSLIAIFGIILFMLLVGLRPSVMRSGLMLILLLLSDLLGMEVDSVNSLGVAVAVMCLTDPMIGGDVGFLLSVFATLGIVVLYPSAYASLKTFFQRYPRVKRIALPVLSALLLSLCANVFILPFQIFIFGAVTFASPIATILLTIPATVLMYSGAVLCLLYLPGFTTQLAAPFQFLAGRCADFMCWVAEKFSAISALQVQFSSGTGIVVLACAFFMFAAVFLIGRNTRRTLFAGITCFVLFICGFYVDAVRYQDVITVAVLNQGTDSCVVLMQNDEASVIAMSGYRTSAVQELLTKQGILRLNTLILKDDGHEGIQAAVNVLSQYTPEQIYIVDDFYAGKQLSSYLTSSEVLSDVIRVELLEGVYGRIYADGSVSISLADGISFYIGEADERAEDKDFLITDKLTEPVNASFIILQTDETDLNALDGEIVTGRYLMADESRTTYVDCFPNGDCRFRREN